MRISLAETFNYFQDHFQDPEDDGVKVFQNEEGQKFISWLQALPFKVEDLQECQQLNETERAREMARLEAILKRQENWTDKTHHLQLGAKYFCLAVVQTSSIAIELSVLATSDNLGFAFGSGIVMAAWSYMATRLFFVEPIFNK